MEKVATGRFENLSYIVALDVERPKRIRALLFHCAGAAAQEIVERLDRTLRKKTEIV